MPLSTIIKQIEQVLEEVLRTVQEEYDHPYSVLCETDRDEFVQEGEWLREQLKELKQATELESNSSWLRQLCFTSPQAPHAAKYLKDAGKLRQRVREHIGAKVRTRLSGRGDLGCCTRGSIARTADTGVEQPPANAGQAETLITSPLNMRCSEPEFSDSEVILFSGAQHDSGHMSEPNVIHTPVGQQSSPRRQRGSPSPLQLNGHPRTPSPPINGAFPVPGLPSPNAVRMPSIPELSPQVDSRSAAEENSSRQTREQWRPRENEANVTNYVNNHRSTNIGMTINNGGTNNAGAVIHRMPVQPSPLPQPIPQFH